LHKKFNSVWDAPLLVTLATFCIILSTANYASLHYGNNQQGILATNSTFINNIQKKLSILRDHSPLSKSHKTRHTTNWIPSIKNKYISQTIHLNIEQLKQSMLSGNIIAVEIFHNQGGDLKLLKNPPPGYIGWNEAIIASLVKKINK